LIDRPEGGEKAVLVHINFPAGVMQEDLTEFKDLAVSAGALPVEIITGTRKLPESKYFIGTGKATEINEVVRAHKAELVIFNHTLTPAQERNLEHLFNCRVIDRTGLILDIFAQRARSFEGKLQVELALLKHMSTRLVRGWTHLERQRGGIGLRGPGETQLETDRRLIKKRIQLITDRLKKVKQQRDQGRKSRRKAIIPTVALVGYTNAGKSTLFNKMTGAGVYVANRLFATLDPTLRRLELPDIGSVILADTVGFIRHLPHDLVEAFHATLEEVTQADLLLHVVDASDENRQSNITQVNHVLEGINAETVPQLMVFNKSDLCTESEIVGSKEPSRIFVSAVTGQGISQLQQEIVKILSKDILRQSLILTPDQSKLRANLYQLNAVQTEKIDDEGNYHLKIKLPRMQWQKLQKRR